MPSPTQTAVSSRRPRGGLLTWIVVAVAVPAMVFAVLAADRAVDPPPTLFGVATGSYGDASGGASPANPDFCRDLRMLADATGRVPAFRQVVWPMMTPDEHWDDDPPADAQPHETQRWRRLSLLESHHRLGTTPYITFEPNRGMGWYRTAEYDRFVDGMVDTLLEWVAMGDGRRVLIAPWPEMNLAEHPWSTPADFSARDYVAAFRDLVRRVRAGGLGSEHVRFVWSVNARPTKGRESYVAYYPGHEYVDLVGIHGLDRSASGWRATYHGPPDHLAELRRQVKRKPILLAQTAAVGPEGGLRENQDEWLAGMAAELADDHQVVGVLYFNRDKAGDADTRAWDSNTDDRVPVGAALRRAIRGTSRAAELAWVFDGSLDDWVSAIGGRPADGARSRLPALDPRPLGGCTPEEPRPDAPADTSPSLLGCRLDTSAPGELPADLVDCVTG